MLKRKSGLVQHFSRVFEHSEYFLMKRLIHSRTLFYAESLLHSDISNPRFSIKDSSTSRGGRDRTTDLLIYRQPTFWTTDAVQTLHLILWVLVKALRLTQREITEGLYLLEEFLQAASTQLWAVMQGDAWAMQKDPLELMWQLLALGKPE